MRSFQPMILGAALFVAGAATLPAFDREDNDYRFRDRERYGDSGSYGRGSPGVVNRVLRDLEWASRGYLDHHERRHIADARENLLRFEDRWAREGWFDAGRLDRAINALHHLANADQIRPRERQVFYEDIRLLQQLGSGPGYRGRGSFPYRRW
ncbi:MAG: hypothetical protein HYR60_16485 [Acidobacteria bacterium]|nr:hypothetical protein [Acidobacteriota bacterium]